MEYQVKITDSAVFVGDKDSSRNQIVIRIEGLTDAAKAARAKISITVKCGNDAASLMASTHECLSATVSDGSGQKKLDPGPIGQDSRCWYTGGDGVSLPASIRLAEFPSRTPPGESEITVLVQMMEGKHRWSEGKTSKPIVTKKISESGQPTIHYFCVDPSYLLHAGETKVEVSFLVTGFDRVSLFRNNEEREIDYQQQGDRITGRFTDTPSITSVYRLTASQASPQSERCVLERTVQVVSSGWNRIAPAQGSPVRLFVANDFRRQTGTDRLYGIFRDAHGQYALYSSATGVDGWEPEPGHVPEHMAMSPGVVYQNNLWLIGGSSVEPDHHCGNEVWCYCPTEPTGKREWVRREDALFSERMGHVCLVFSKTKDGKREKEIWLLGGYRSGEAYNDLWRATESPTGGLVWERIAEACPWDERFNPAAVALTRDNGPCEVWLFGGTNKPQTDNLLDERFWRTIDGKNWISKNPVIVEQDLVMKPSPGCPLACTLVASPSESADQSGGSSKAELLLIGSFRDWDTYGSERLLGNRVSSYLFEWQPGHAYWKTEPVLQGWQQFDGGRFYMQGIAFNRFLFVWSLQPGEPTSTKLIIHVPE